jgi:hypothetical protein
MGTDRMRRRNRWLRAVAGFGIAMLILAALVTLRTERGARAAVALIGDASGYEIELQTMQVAGWRWTVDDLRVGVAGEEALFRAGRVTLDLNPASLLRWRVRSVVLDSFELDLSRLPGGEGGRMQLPFEELRATNGVVRYASAATSDIRVREIVLARAQPNGDFDIRGRLESGADLDIGWSGRAAPNGDDLAVHFEGTLRNVASILYATALLGADSSSLLSFSGDLTGELHGDLHATAAAELRGVALRGPVRATLVLDRNGGTGELSGEVGVKDLSATAGELIVDGTASLTFAYVGGALTSRGDGLVLDDLEIASPTMKAAIKHLSAEPSIDGGSATKHLRLERVEANGIAFSKMAHELQASGLEVSGRLELAIAGDRRRLATLALTAPRGEVLYKLAYLDIATSPAELSLRITSKDTGWTGEGSVKLADLGEVRADGDVDASSALQRLHVDVEIPRLRAPFERLVRDTFADVYPMLSRTTLTGGASVDIEVRSAASGSSARGLLRLQDVAVTVEEPSIHAKGIVLDLPIALSSGERAEEKPSSGRVRIAEATFGKAAIGAVDVPLAVRANEITATASLPISIARGTVLIEGLRAHALTSDAPTLEASVMIEKMDLAELSVAAGLPRMDGAVHGPLGLVRIADGRVTTEAAIDLTAFGGNVRISDVSMDELFSRVPALRLDAVLSRIDLGEASVAIGVGEVSGIAEGEVLDLEIAAGAPVRFDAHLESVPVSGVAQRISVTAIDQLAVMGGGASGSLARGMMGLFDEYRYAKLGFRCTLSNDRFVLRGVTEHDGKDFLVVGTIFPPSVNVVSHNRVIVFKEMVERLQRVTSSAETEPQ